MAAIVAGEVLARLEATGKNAAGTFTGARGRYDVIAAENHTDSAQGVHHTWWGTPTGSTSMIERMVLAQGKLALGTGIESALGAGLLAGDMFKMARESAANAENTSIVLQQYKNTFASFSTMLGRVCRGTAAAPRRTKSGDVLLRNSGSGWQAADDSTTATIVSAGRVLVDWVASEDWTSTAQGAKLQISTNPIGAASTAILRATVDENGLTLADAMSIVTGTTLGMKIGTATTQKLGFFNATPVVQQTDGAALTNNVTSGGTTDTIANFTDLTLYANDAAAIRNDIYQLARKVKIVDDALRTYGFLS